MDEPEAAAVFAGDLADPWVAAIAAALPRATIRVDCPADLPEDLPELAAVAPLVVLHRTLPTGLDLERLGRLRTRPGGPPRVVLCIGPEARQHLLERWAPLVDALVPEAIAAEVVGRYAADGPIGRGRGERLAVVAADYELRVYLSDACHRAGYAATSAPAWAEAPPDLPALWAAPTLEPGWVDELAERAEGRPLVALAPFVDRRTVALSRARGAAACLDLPCDPADLAWVLDRVLGRREGLRFDPGHGEIRRGDRGGRREAESQRA